MAAYRHLSEELAAAGAEALAAAGDDPRARLRAFLSAGFQPPFLAADRLTARVALWSIAATEPALHAVHAELYARYRAELKELIGALVARRPGRRTAWSSRSRRCSTACGSSARRATAATTSTRCWTPAWRWWRRTWGVCRRVAFAWVIRRRADHPEAAEA